MGDFDQKSKAEADRAASEAEQAEAISPQHAVLLGLAGGDTRKALALHKRLRQRRNKAHATGSDEADHDDAAGADAVGPLPRGGGAPLSGPLAAQLQQSYGQPLGDVRLHTGDDSAEVAAALGARALTVGNDIHFGHGQYDPSSAGGQQLIAHETAHTVQQQGVAAAAPQAKLTVGSPGDGAEAEADRAADAALSGQRAPALTRQSSPRLQRQVTPPPPTPTATQLHSGAELKAMTLEALKRYSDEQIDWANSASLNDADRALVWRWVLFAKEGEGNLAGAGKMTVAALDKAADSDAKREALRVYGGAISGLRPTARIETPAKDVHQMIDWGQRLGKLEEALGGPTVNRIVNDKAWKLLAKDASLVDYVVDYSTTIAPVLDAENGAEIDSMAAMKRDATPYSTYKGDLPEIKNFHRFEQKGLAKVAANKKDTSRSRPFTLVLHSALDHNGAYHRDPNLTAVLAHDKNLTLMIEGAESLDSIKGQIDPLATQYGQLGSDGKGKIDQVMIAGHGNSSLIELSGKMQMGAMGKTQESGEALKNDDPKSQALLDELLKHMDPASPHHELVFNACLTASNSVDSQAIRDAVAAGKSPADAVKEAMKKNPSFVAALGDRAQALGVGGISAVGANNSIAQVELMDKSGAMKLKDPDDPEATGTKMAYVEKGLEPLGVMRAVVESWAQDKAATLAAMKRRTKSGAISDWRNHIVVEIFSIILANYPDDVATINDFSEWAGSLGEGLHEEECRVALFTPPTSIAAHMPTVTQYVLSHVDFSAVPHFPMVLHQTEYLQGLSPKNKLLADLSSAKFNCSTVDQFIDDRVFDKLPDLLGALDAGHLHGQLLVALLDVVHHEKPHDPAKAFLIAHGVSSKKLTAQASAILAHKLSDNKVLERLELIGAPKGEVPKANADSDGDKQNDLYVEPVSLSGSAMYPYGPVEVREAPNGAAPTLATLADGAPVTIVGRVDKWYAIQQGLKLGYVEQVMVWLQQSDKPQPFAAQGTVSNPLGCDVMDGPDSSAAKLGELKPGDTMMIVARVKERYGIHYANRTAWVSRFSVAAKKLKLTLMSAKGTLANETSFFDHPTNERKELGKLAAGSAVDIAARVDDEATPGPAGAFFATKQGSAYVWIQVADVTL